MPAERRQIVAFALLAVVMVLWAGNSIVGRAVRFDVPPLTLAFVRWYGASLILLPFAWRPLKRDWPAIRRAWKPVLLLGLLGVGAFNALLLQAAIPAAVVVLDRAFFRERSPRVQNLGVLFATVGVAAVVFEGDPARALQMQFGAGDLFVLASVLVWALYTVFLRLRPPIDPVSFVAATFIIGAISMAPLRRCCWERSCTSITSAG